MSGLKDESEKVGPITQHLVTADLIPRAAMAQQLGVCPRTLRLWERVGRGPPAIRIGKRIYYRAESARTWLLAQERGTGTR
jgi:hypothetical protein